MLGASGAESGRHLFGTSREDVENVVYDTRYCHHKMTGLLEESGEVGALCIENEPLKGIWRSSPSYIAAQYHQVTQC